MNEAQLRQLQVQTLPCLGVATVDRLVCEICLSTNQESERSSSNKERVYLEHT